MYPQSLPDDIGHYIWVEGREIKHNPNLVSVIEPHHLQTLLIMAGEHIEREPEDEGGGLTVGWWFVERELATLPHMSYLYDLDLSNLKPHSNTEGEPTILGEAVAT